MREITIILAAVLLMLVLSGCAQQTAPLKQGSQGNTTAPNTTAPANNTQTQNSETTPPVTTAYSVNDCSLLTANDMQSVVGIPVKGAVFYAYPQGTCSRGWVDTRAGTDAIVVLSLNKVGDESAIKANLDISCLESVTAGSTTIKNPIGMKNIESVPGLGDYQSCWYKGPYDSVNFGKGKYRFLLKCTGSACSKDKAVELAKLALGRIS